MTEQVTGVINFISSRVVPTKYGDSTAYSLKLEDNETWYSAGFKAPAVKEGDTVTFMADTNAAGYWNLDPKSLEIMQKAAATSKPKDAGPSRRASAGGGLSKDDYWKNREERDLRTQQVIQLQAARNAAIALVNSAVQNGIINLGKTQSKQLGVYLEAVDEVTRRFYNDTKPDDWRTDGTVAVGDPSSTMGDDFPEEE